MENVVCAAAVRLATEQDSDGILVDSVSGVVFVPLKQAAMRSVIAGPAACRGRRAESQYQNQSNQLAIAATAAQKYLAQSIL